MNWLRSLWGVCREWLKWQLAGDELRKLQLYRSQIWAADRWLACDERAVALCEWIKSFPEQGYQSEHIEDFRQRYRRIPPGEMPANLLLAEFQRWLAANDIAGLPPDLLEQLCVATFNLPVEQMPLLEPHRSLAEVIHQAFKKAN